MHEDTGSTAVLNEKAQSYEKQAIPLINQLSSYLNLHQCNLIRNYSNNVILDLTLSSNIVETFEHDPLLPLDNNHPAFTTNIPIKSTALIDHCLNPVGKYYNFKLADYYNLNMFYSSQNWDQLFLNKSFNEMTDIFYSLLQRGIQDYVPESNYRSMSSFPRWYSKELRKNIAFKKAAHLKFKKTKSLTDYNEFRSFRSKC